MGYRFVICDLFNMVPGLRNDSLENRLKDLKLPTLTYRRLRGNVMEVLKLVNDMWEYYFDCANLFTIQDQSKRVVRWNKKKLFKHIAKLDVGKYSFNNRIVGVWDSLVDSVISAEIVFSFETGQDKYWKGQDIYMNLNVR